MLRFRSSSGRERRRSIRPERRSRTNSPRCSNFLVAVLPPMRALLVTLTNVINLWLAERIVKISGRLQRPSGDLSAMSFPSFAPAVLAVAAVVAAFLPDLVGLIGSMLATSLLFAYALLGLAVLHAITAGVGGRGIMLTGLYLATVLFGWPLILMAALGLADTDGFDLRARAARRAPVPQCRSLNQRRKPWK